MFHQPAQTRTGAMSTSRFNFRSAKMLLADDNQQALDILCQVLLGFGVRNATPVRSVMEAIEQLQKDRFDLVVADGEMPDSNGFDLTRYIRSNPESANFTVPVIITSGFTPATKIARARDAGANLVVKKPIVPGVLLSRIEWLARSPREFVTSPGYCGPDRRFKNMPLPDGVTERRADGIKLMEQPERAMSQNEIDSLFN